MAFVVKAETASEVTPLIKKYVEEGSCIMTDSSNAYTRLCPVYDHRAVNHSIEYMKDDGTNNNQAECFNSRLRRAEFGVFNGMRPQYLYLYLAEFVWRTNFKRKPLKEKFDHVLLESLKASAHSVFKNYGRNTKQNRKEILY